MHVLSAKEALESSKAKLSHSACVASDQTQTKVGISPLFPDVIAHTWPYEAFLSKFGFLNG